MKRVSLYFRLQSNQKVRNYYGKRIYDILQFLEKENRLSSFKQIKHNRRDSLFFLTVLAANDKNLLFQFTPHSIPPVERLERSSSGFSKIIVKNTLPFDEKKFLQELILREIKTRTNGVIKENLTLAVLLELASEGIIKNAFLSTEHQDIEGADIIVQFNAENGYPSAEIFLQVKSDYKSQQIHQEKQEKILGLEKPNKARDRPSNAEEDSA